MSLAFSGSDPFQQVRSWLVFRILRCKFSAHGEVKHEAAQAGNGVGRIGYTVEMGEKVFAVHASGVCGSASSTRTRLRSFGRSFSV